MAKIVIVKSFKKGKKLSKLVKIVQNYKENGKIVKNFQNCENFQHFCENCQKLSKIVENIENCEKKIVKIAKNCQNVAQVMFSHHSDQMSQSGRSLVSKDFHFLKLPIFSCPTFTNSSSTREAYKTFTFSTTFTFLSLPTLPDFLNYFSISHFHQLFIIMSNTNTWEVAKGEGSFYFPQLNGNTWEVGRVEEVANFDLETAR